MPRKDQLVKIANFTAKFFYIFLDISGILLGIFLVFLGLGIVSGFGMGKIIGYIVILLGVCAFIIHVGHYFSLKITRWIFGDKDYFKKRPQ